MVCYANGKVYKLVSTVDGKEYVGSTCCRLTDRKCHHKKTSVKYPNRRVYAHFIKIGMENMQIVLIEDFPCESSNQLKKRERYWYEQLKPALNMIRPQVTPGEKKQRVKDYYQKPEIKAHKLEYSKEYRSRPEIKAHISQRSREYRNNPENKAHKSHRAAERIQCPCGATHSRGYASPHRKTAKHKNALAEIKYNKIYDRIIKHGLLNQPLFL